MYLYILPRLAAMLEIMSVGRGFEWRGVYILWCMIWEKGRKGGDG